MKLFLPVLALLQGAAFVSGQDDNTTRTSLSGSFLSSECDLVLYASLEKAECLAELGLTDMDQVTEKTPIPKLELGEQIFADGYNFLHMLTGAVVHVGVEEAAADLDLMARKLGEEGGQNNHRELPVICDACQNANNWRRCIKNNCRRRLLRGGAEELEELRTFTGRDLQKAANKIRQEQADFDVNVRRFRQLSTIDEGETFALDHDRALVQETINQAVRKGHPCALEFSIILPELEAVQQKIAAEDPFICPKPRTEMELECSHLKDCGKMYPHIGSYDCKNEEGGICFCGDNQMCGCLADPVIEGDNTNPDLNYGDDTCNKSPYQGECSTTWACKRKYWRKDAYTCDNRKGGVCMCGAGDICGCKYPEFQVGGDNTDADSPRAKCAERLGLFDLSNGGHECIERSECKHYKQNNPDEIYGIQCENSICKCKDVNYEFRGPCACWDLI